MPIPEGSGDNHFHHHGQGGHCWAEKQEEERVKKALLWLLGGRRGRALKFRLGSS